MTDEDIRNLYRQEIGREPTSSEISEARSFGQNDFVGLSRGDIAAIGMSNPQSRLEQLRRYGGEYEQRLSGADDRYLQMAQDRLQSDFARQGRTLGGSAYVNAFSNAARDLALQRQSQLADFYRPGYQQIFGEIGQRGQLARQQGYRGLERAQERAYDIQDYYRQKDDLEGQLRAQSRRNLQGSLIQGGIGLVGSIAGGLAQGYGMGKGFGAVRRSGGFGSFGGGF